MIEPGKRAASKPGTDSASRELLTVADMEQAAANYESAIRTYRQALEQAAVPEEHIRGLRGVGSCLERLGRWKEALSVLEDAAAAARVADVSRELGPILIKIGKIRLGRGEIQLAIDLGQEALDLIDPKLDPSPQGFALNLLGSAHNRLGDLETSASCFQAALGAFKGAGDIRSLSLAYNNLGLIHKEKCDWTRAQEYLQVASSLQAIEGDYPERRSALHNLGLVHFRMGNWNRARECFEEALVLARKVNDPLGSIRILLGSAGVDLVERRWDDALETLEQALELCSEEEYPRESALTYRSLGQLHQVRGEFDRARRCLEVAWRKTVETSPEGDLARELLRLRSDLARSEGRLDDAANLARRALELSTSAGDRMETALARACHARVRHSLGDPAFAEDFRLAVNELRQLDSPYPLVETLLDEAGLLLKSGTDLAEAETGLVEALDRLQGLGLPELESEALIMFARVAIRRGELDRAGEYLESARRQAAEHSGTGVSRHLVEAQTELETQLVDTSVANLGAYRTAGRLEEILDSRSPYEGKLAAVLEIMAQATDASAAALIFVSETMPGSTYRLGTAPAETLTRILRAETPERPEIVLDTATAVAKPWTELVVRRQVSSFVVIPLYGNGNAAYLYLDRLTDERRSAFGQSHLNLALALTPQLESLVDRAALEASRPSDEDTLKRRTFLADVVTQNPEMVEILKLAEKINRTDLTVLLQGETGTGKTLIARAIHLSSDRSKGPFVTVDCAALPDNLLESELFGYVKGAFTGAAVDKKGLFEEADGGTIFLDEVGKAGLGVQRRLLHLLDRGEVRPVGATRYRKLNVRVICATSKKDLLEDTEEPFIKDLYFRLNDIIIRVPALRERVEDIPLLTEYFLAMVGVQIGRELPEFSRATMQRLVRYSWPGNVRELEKVVRRAAILADDGETIGVELLPREVLEATETRLSANGGGDGQLRSTVEDMERRLVQDALQKHGWNRTRAAKELGLSRKGLKNKIARYGLIPPA